jgi:hypothetical protein
LDGFTYRITRKGASGRKVTAVASEGRLSREPRNKHAKQRIVNHQEFSQSIQPWEYGHPETKRTCFGLKNRPPVKPTNIVEGREARVHKMPPGPDRWRERS